MLRTCGLHDDVPDLLWLLAPALADSHLAEEVGAAWLCSAGAEHRPVLFPGDEAEGDGGEGDGEDGGGGGGRGGGL